MFQQIILIGNLGNDPEMRYTQSGVPVASFRMAVNRSWTNQEGQRQDKTTWFRVTAWRKTAENVSQYLTKGSKVLVVGEIEDSQAYIDREGSPRASLEVTAQNVKFLSTRGEAAVPGMPGGERTEMGGQGGGELHEEEIPF